MLTWNSIVDFATKGNPAPADKVIKSDEQWRALLSDEAFYVTRNKGTERPHSSDSCTLFEPGEYACVCCNNVLFEGGEKFDSGTGWPSFTQPATTNAIAYNSDVSHGMQRIEAVCNVCDAHLGHVFPDGPMPSRLRYCVNALSLKKL
ncbi:peptide-methionine (R)-S-oxide reductase MsrB [Pseudoalteromonas sp. H105]|uniref:peptide-methionine (R)-S-oxide reductase MsrB n=1 Tax=Pseudoalteromonas sp. H105 TaxID=1348393 RepID=UPI000731F75A|nr:peptide-methionine (R)-S-oxide reductase MsrB [Pseudoalteromonas sp. H105]KTF14771.1 peptide methionine sulfoxide reductase MsrB [Pseudoalteromonas sp. H105]